MFFANSGAEANECAIKTARKYGNLKYGRNEIITLKNSFHGRTMATLSATGQEAFHKYFDPFLGGFKYAEPDIDGVIECYTDKTCAVMVECMTDNRNRTASEVRHAFTKFGGNLGSSGSVNYLFTKKGVVSFIPDESGNMALDEEKAMDIALEAGADDVVTNEDGSIDVYTSPEAFPAVVDAFNDNNIKPDNAQVTMTPSTEADLDADTAVKFMRMIDALEDLDDVQEVYHNASIPDDVNLD